VSSDASAEIPKSAKTAAKAIKPVSRPMSNTGAKLRPNAPQARDARVDRDSMGDFAEFIRSTGQFYHLICLKLRFGSPMAFCHPATPALLIHMTHQQYMIALILTAGQSFRSS
jgi:hypothetical protein